MIQKTIEFNLWVLTVVALTKLELDLLFTMQSTTDRMYELHLLSTEDSIVKISNDDPENN